MISHSTLLQFLNVYDWIVFFAVLIATLASVVWGQRLKQISRNLNR